MQTKHILSAVTLALSATAMADTATYTFEAPQFASGAPLPLNNIAPNSTSGPTLALLTTTFTANTSPSTIVVGSVPFSPPITAQYLIEQTLVAGQLLQISLSQPVFTVDLDFVLNNASGVSYLQFKDGGITLNAPRTFPATFDQGHLTYTNPAGLSSFTLEGFDPANTQIQFAMDNLVVTVPEPASAALLGFGTLGLLARRRAQT